jgi:hypothetical protein
MAEPSATSSGRLLAAVLAASWRPSPAPVEISVAELEQLAPLLLSSGAAALVWRRVRQTSLHDSTPVLQMQHAFRLQAIGGAVHERDIRRAFELLRSRGIEPLLIKGWVAARAYPERGLRPMGDLDLCVAPQQFTEAQAALRDLKSESPVDLHCGLSKLDDRSWDELFARSGLLSLGDLSVRVLAPEDHLRLLCVHLLKHGASRPLWLCDVSAALETRPANFDWDRCLGSKRRADWVASAVYLAHQLLGAEIDGTPFDNRAKRLPGWLASTVLKQWEKPASPVFYAMPMAARLRYRSGFMSAVQSRWPNPIEATIHLRGPFNRWPRWPFQLASYFARSAQFMLRLPKLMTGKQTRLNSFVLHMGQLPVEPCD